MPPTTGVGVSCLDHVVMAVSDLNRATVDLRALGFTATAGGRHNDGRTENALLAFADGTYIEVVGFTDAPNAREHRWWARLEEGEGLIDHSFAVADVERAKAAFEQSGRRASEVLEGGRVRLDGAKLAWRTVQLGLGFGDPLLPFLIQDVTARALRVPSGHAARHANGASGIAGLRLESPDPAGSARAFSALVGEGRSGADGDTAFDVGRQRIVVSGTAVGAPRVSGLEIRGARLGMISPMETHGVRMLVAT